jgi:hypothetical protein
VSDAARPSFYALRAGGWRDYWTLLHAPYTAWHLSYVAMGAALAQELSVPWLAESLLAFLLAMGVAAHALDELQGRPLRTEISSGVLWLLAGLALGGAVALGVHGMVVVSPWLGLFIAVGVVLVLAYNLELFGGRLHSDGWFAAAWGAFPALTGYFAQTGRVSAAAVVLAVACAALSLGQRRLSTPARRVRRRAVAIEGRVQWVHGGREAIGADTLIGPAEGALRALSLALPL